MKTKPYKFQKRGVRRMIQFHGRVLLADEMGLGKTLQSLMYYSKFVAPQPCLIICPASLKYNWQREAKIHLGLRAEVLEGRKPPRRQRLLKLCPLVIINYDILSGWRNHIKRMDPALVVIDECHMLGNRSTIRTKMTKSICRKAPDVIALSGTPLTNRPSELWPTLNILRPDLYPSFFAYAQEYCGPKRNPWGWEYKGATQLPKLHKELKDKNDGLMIRRLKSQVLKDLPAKSRHVVPLPISKEKEYKKAELNFIGWLRSRSRAKAKRAERAERLVRWGYLKRLAAECKLPSVFDWVDTFLQESDSKLILFGIHTAIIRPLHERYKDISVVVHGRVKGRKRQRRVDKFQTNPGCSLFIGNIQAAGVGLTLTAAPTVAFTEIGWTPGEHIQAEDRAHRIGQMKEVSIYYLVGKGTIEYKLCGILQKKQKTISSVLDGGGLDQDLKILDQLERRLLNG